MKPVILVVFEFTAEDAEEAAAQVSSVSSEATQLVLLSVLSKPGDRSQVCGEMCRGKGWAQG